MASTLVFQLDDSVKRGSVRRSATGFTFTRRFVLEKAARSIVNVAADKIKTGDLVFFSKSPDATAELITSVVIPRTRGEATRLNGKSYSSTAKFDVIRAAKLR